MTTLTAKSLRRLVLEALYITPLSPRQLVAHCDGYTYNAVLVQVGRLREKGLVRARSQEPDLDGSRLAYRLTEKGRAVVDAYQDGPRCPHCGGKL
jgi:DNA-binding HxlR family transcriptional regulator